MSATTTQLLSSGEFFKLRYDTIPVKSASANVSFYTNNSKMPNFELCCRKWAIYSPNVGTYVAKLKAAVTPWYPQKQDRSGCLICTCSPKRDAISIRLYGHSTARNSKKQ